VVPAGLSPVSLKPTTFGMSMLTGWRAWRPRPRCRRRPAEHAEPVDHRGVAVGADERVGVGIPRVVNKDDARQVLDIDLVDDAGAGRDDGEVVERALSPAQELVALAVALVFEFDVAAEGIRGTEEVGDDAVVDDELGRRQRVDLRRLAAEITHRLAHGREVDDARHSGEVLHDHPRRVNWISWLGWPTDPTPRARGCAPR